MEIGYLTNYEDRGRLSDPAFRDIVAEGILVAVKRLYLLGEDDQPTGTFTFADVLATNSPNPSSGPTAPAQPVGGVVTVQTGPGAWAGADVITVSRAG